MRLIKKKDKGNLGQKGLSNDTKVDFAATKDHSLAMTLKRTAKSSFLPKFGDKGRLT